LLIAEAVKKVKKKTKPAIILKKTVDNRLEHSLFFSMSALLKQLLTNDSETAMKIVIMLIKPNPRGVRIRAE